VLPLREVADEVAESSAIFPAPPSSLERDEEDTDPVDSLPPLAEACIWRALLLALELLNFGAGRLAALGELWKSGPA
jgi:hypothetical protein